MKLCEILVVSDPYGVHESLMFDAGRAVLYCVVLYFTGFRCLGPDVRKMLCGMMYPPPQPNRPARYEIAFVPFFHNSLSESSAKTKQTPCTQTKLSAQFILAKSSPTLLLISRHAPTSCDLWISPGTANLVFRNRVSCYRSHISDLASLTKKPQDRLNKDSIQPIVSEKLELIGERATP